MGTIVNLGGMNPIFEYMLKLIVLNIYMQVPASSQTSPTEDSTVTLSTTSTTTSKPSTSVAPIIGPQNKPGSQGQCNTYYMNVESQPALFNHQG